MALDQCPGRHNIDPLHWVETSSCNFIYAQVWNTITVSNSAMHMRFQKLIGHANQHHLRGSLGQEARIWTPLDLQMLALLLKLKAHQHMGFWQAGPWQWCQDSSAHLADHWGLDHGSAASDSSHPSELLKNWVKWSYPRHHGKIWKHDIFGQWHLHSPWAAKEGWVLCAVPWKHYSFLVMDALNQTFSVVSLWKSIKPFWRKPADHRVKCHHNWPKICVFMYCSPSMQSGFLCVREGMDVFGYPSVTDHNVIWLTSGSRTTRK